MEDPTGEWKSSLALGDAIHGESSSFLPLAGAVHHGLVFYIDAPRMQQKRFEEV